MDDRARLTELLVAELERAPVEALIDQTGVDWAGLAAEITEVKKTLQAELAAAPPGSDRESSLRAALGMAPPLPIGGPGTELKAMTTRLGIPACQSCSADAAWMDRLGVDGCKLRIDEIVARIGPRASRLGWLTKAGAAAKAVALGLPLTVRGMVELAIERATAKAPAGESQRAEP